MRRSFLDSIKRSIRRSTTSGGGIRRPGFYQRSLRCEPLEERRLLAAGDLDTSFGEEGWVVTPFGAGTAMPVAVGLLPEGKIVLGGSYGGNFAVAQYEEDGQLDATFSQNGTAFTDFGSPNDTAFDMAIQEDGMIVMAGYTFSGIGGGNWDFALVRYNTNGQPDGQFGNDGKVITDFAGDRDIAYAVAIQPDGKIIAGGYACASPGSQAWDGGLVRYNADGSLDGTFGVGGKVYTDFGGDTESIRSVAVLPDGKIMVGGNTYNGAASDTVLVRYHPDGTLDTTFSEDGILVTPFGGGVKEMVIQPDGKVLVLGSLPSSIIMSRYNPDGSLDTTFDEDGQLNEQFLGAIEGVAIQGDGKIVLAGHVMIGGVSGLAVLRFLPDATPDMDFGQDSLVLTPPVMPGGDKTCAVTIQSDTKILVAAASYNNFDSAFSMARFMADTTPPEASLTITDITLSGNTSHSFTVEYTDNVAVDVESIDASDLMITAPNGSMMQVEFREVDQDEAGSPRVATYMVNSPVGQNWNWNHIGTYTISIQFEQVVDTHGNFLPEGELGTFRVDVSPSLGALTYQEINDLDLSNGERQYRLETTHQGFLTIDATSLGGPDDVQLTLYDPERNELATSTPIDGKPRIDWRTEAGVMYYVQAAGTGADVDLRLANIVDVSIDGTEVKIYGTEGDDTYQTSILTPYVTVGNGLRYDTPVRRDLLFFGEEGDNGFDTVIFHDSPGDDEFVGWANGGSLSAGDATFTATNFEQLIVYADNGGDDTANLYDSPGDDLYVTTAIYGGISHDGVAIHTQGFDNVTAFAGNGGNDMAKMFDSPGDDQFYANPTEATLSGDFGGGFSRRAKFFPAVHSYASNGGNDTAEFFDSTANEVFWGRAVDGGIIGDGILARAKHFENIHHYADAGGFDIAKFFDSPGNDQFVATPPLGTLSYGDLSGGVQHQHAHNFDQVHAYGTAGGHDVANLYDSDADDLFYGDPIQGSLFNPGVYFNRAKFFEEVRGHADNGGRDRADLFGSDGDDTLVASATDGTMSRAAVYSHHVESFEEVYADAGGDGVDTAHLSGSAAVDLLEAEGNWARVSSEAVDFLISATGFDPVEATTDSADDTKNVTDPLDFDLQLIGPW